MSKFDSLLDRKTLKSAELIQQDQDEVIANLRTNNCSDEAINYILGVFKFHNECVQMVKDFECCVHP